MPDRNADVIVQDQVGCARCDGDGHPGMEYLKLQRPIVVGEYEFSHWAPCPTTGEPILLLIHSK